MGGITALLLYLFCVEREMTEQKLLERIEYVEKLIGECTQLKNDWEQRVKEVEEVRDNYRLLIKQLVRKNSDDN